MLNYLFGMSSGGLSWEFLSYILSMIAVVFIVLPIHEWAHGMVSTKLGDPTPRLSGRLTFNPIAHIDIVGALSIFLFGIGWAKPVPVNPSYYKNRKGGMALVAFAGPAANIVLSFVLMILYHLFSFNVFVARFCFYISYISVYLAVFNLIPLPPFDGSRIFLIFLPEKYYFKIMRYERYIMMILFILLISDRFTGIISNTLGFISVRLFGFIDSIAYLPFKLFGV